MAPVLGIEDSSEPAKQAIYEGNVEATFSMIKRKFGDSLRSRSDVAMKNEVVCKILCHAIRPFTLRVRDHEDPIGATVDIDICEDGRPLTCRADRPRLVGKKAALTPWSAASLDFREWEGLRVANKLEAAWQLPEGAFTYYRSGLTAFVAVR